LIRVLSFLIVFIQFSIKIQKLNICLKSGI
jgi:hypothetical protein